MRTTISIDDEVLSAAKRRAADEDRSLGELVTEALRERLARRPPTHRDRYEPVTWR
ncbi:MAG: type II toxin-antitoxin system VapB family antitoxin, partial [Actinomycetota bacterium]|nr:type II toxin-antitoxin system VapB family antitoxin [Actinomycetota bacterium]